MTIKCRFAHRGFYDGTDIPENSMAAFKRAAAFGFGVEFDVHMLSDGTLAVFHDSDLSRCTGENGVIEELDCRSLKKLRLNGTDEQIPLFGEVLDFFENELKSGNSLPLMIELKTTSENRKQLSDAVIKRLADSKTEYYLESFDPFAVKYIKSVYPDIVCGQLAQNFKKEHEGLPVWSRGMLTDMRGNRFSHPDFISYRLEHIDRRSVKRNLAKGRGLAVWVVRNKKDYDYVVSLGGAPIFEGFNPDET